MNSFTKSLRVQPKVIKKTIEPLDVYRDFVSNALPSFLAYMEAINNAITSLEDDLVMSDIKFKARIKDITGTLNSDPNKPLDDIFGFEIITPNEADKELLILLLDINSYSEKGSRINVHDKSNGYFAFHRVSALKNKFNPRDFEGIREYITRAKTIKLKKKYRDLNRLEQMELISESFPKANLYDEVFMYPVLRELNEGDSLSDYTLKALIKASLIIYKNLSDPEIENIPIVETQFKTSDVAQDAIFGSARHFDYKTIDKIKIKEMLEKGEMTRGINFPFKFTRNGNKMYLQEAYKTIFEMYPFLKDVIMRIRLNNPSGLPLENKNTCFKRVFPCLTPYIETSSELHLRSEDPDLNWQIIKSEIGRSNDERQ